MSSGMSARLQEIIKQGNQDRDINPQQFRLQQSGSMGTPRELASLAQNVQQQTPRDTIGGAIGNAAAQALGGIAQGQQAQNRELAADEFNQFLKENRDKDLGLGEVADKAMEIGNKHGVPELQQRAQQISQKAKLQQEQRRENLQTRLDVQETAADLQQQQGDVTQQRFDRAMAISEQAPKDMERIIDTQTDLKEELNNSSMNTSDLALLFMEGGEGLAEERFQQETGERLEEVMDEGALQRLDSLRREFDRAQQIRSSFLGRARNQGGQEQETQPSVAESPDEATETGPPTGPSGMRLGPTMERAEQGVDPEGRFEGRPGFFKEPDPKNPELPVSSARDQQSTGAPKGGQRDDGGQMANDLTIGERADMAARRIRQGDVTLDEALRRIDRDIPEDSVLSEQKKELRQEITKRATPDSLSPDFNRIVRDNPEVSLADIGEEQELTINAVEEMIKRLPEKPEEGGGSGNIENQFTETMRNAENIILDSFRQGVLSRPKAEVALEYLRTVANQKAESIEKETGNRIFGNNEKPINDLSELL